MGGVVAQLLYRRHPSLLSGLVLCSTAGSAAGSPAERLAALALPAAAAAARWNPLLRMASTELLGMALLGPVDDPATASWARAQLRRTPLATAISASRAVCEFSSDGWIGQVDVPTAVVVTTRDRLVPASRQLKLARAVPGASVHEVDADHGVCITAPQMLGPGAAPGMLAGDPGIFDMGGVGVDVVHGRGDPGTTQGLLDRDQVHPAQVKLGGIRNAAAHAA